jgi:urease alpha subunit
MQFDRFSAASTRDRVRLGDTNLLVEVERDEASPGDETLWGLGETISSTLTCRRGHASRGADTI